MNYTTKHDWKSITLPYSDHKKTAYALISIADEELDTLFSVAKIKNLKECGNYLQFVHGTTSARTFLSGANFCKNRMCPMCAWRKRVNIYGTYRVAITSLATAMSKKDTFAHITLTVKNTAITNAKDLKHDLEILRKAFYNFRRRISRANDGQYCLGTHAQMEVTINQKTKTWHPHIHMLALLNQKHYKGQDTLNTMWKKCLSSTEGFLYIQKIADTKDNLPKAVAEVCKYPIKFTDKHGSLLIRSGKQYSILSQALYGSRCSWDTGKIKTAKALAVSQQLSIADLLKYEEQLIYYTLGFRNGNYELIKEIITQNSFAE